MLFIVSMVYLMGFSVTVGVLMQKSFGPDPGVWMAIGWPITLLAYFGTKLAKVFK